MADIYVYRPDGSDMDTFGLVGALPYTEAKFEAKVNDYCELSLEMPMDDMGIHMVLQPGYILAADVPVPYTPSISAVSPTVNTVIPMYTISISATKAERQMYKARDKDKKLKVANPGDLAAVLESNEEWDRWRIRTGKLEGWIAKDTLVNADTVNVSPDLGSLDELLGNSGVKTQYFRIYDVKRRMDKVEVKAEHISYDLNKNLSYYNSNVPVPVNTALQGILNSCSDEIYDVYTIRTNIASDVVNANYLKRGPIDSILNEDDGIAGRVNGQFVRDNYSLYLLTGLERYRGFRIEYGFNMTGFDYEEDWSDTYNRCVPVGKDKDDNDLYPDATSGIFVSDYLGDMCELKQDTHGDKRCYIQSKRSTEYPDQYAVPRYTVIDTGAKVEDGKTTITEVRLKMAAEARAFFEDGGDMPKVTVKVEFARMSDEDRYRYLANLESVRLWDIVRLVNPRHGVDILAKCTEIEWDVGSQKVSGVTLESVISSYSFCAKPRSSDDAYDSITMADGKRLTVPSYTVR